MRVSYLVFEHHHSTPHEIVYRERSNYKIYELLKKENKLPSKLTYASDESIIRGLAGIQVIYQTYISSNKHNLVFLGGDSKAQKEDTYTLIEYLGLKDTYKEILENTTIATLPGKNTEESILNYKDAEEIYGLCADKIVAISSYYHLPKVKRLLDEHLPEIPKTYVKAHDLVLKSLNLPQEIEKIVIDNKNQINTQRLKYFYGILIRKIGSFFKGTEYKVWF